MAILSEIKSYFTTNLPSVKFYTGMALTQDTLPYVVLVPGDYTCEYTTAMGANNRETQDTFIYELHLFHRSSDGLETLITSVTNAFDNHAVCSNCMDNTRNKITYDFPDTYNAQAILFYTCQRQGIQNPA